MVNVVQHSAIEVVATVREVRRQRDPGKSEHLLEIEKRIPCSLEPRTGCEVEAKAQVDDGPNDGRLFNHRTFAIGGFDCKLKSAIRVCLPKVDALAEPVPIVSRWDEWLIVEE